MQATDILDTQTKATRRIKRKKFVDRVTKALLALFGLLLLFAILTIFQTSSSANQKLENVEKLGDSSEFPNFRIRYEALGGSIVQGWFSGQKVTVPYEGAWPNTPAGDVKSVAFVNGVQVSDPSLPAEARYEKLQYFVVLNDQSLLVEVVLSLIDVEDVAILPQLMSPPLIIQQLNDVEIQELKAVGLNSFTEGVTITAEIQSQSERWVQAWVDNDSVFLKNLTQDDRVETRYQGLKGPWVLIPDSTRVEWATQDSRTNDRAIVRVSWRMTLGSSENIIFQEAELLVGKPDSGAPSILSWGASGFGSNLEPLDRAIGEEELRVDSLSDEVTSEPDELGGEDDGSENITPETTEPEPQPTVTVKPEDNPLIGE